MVEAEDGGGHGHHRPVGRRRPQPAHVGEAETPEQHLLADAGRDGHGDEPPPLPRPARQQGQETPGLAAQHLADDVSPVAEDDGAEAQEDPDLNDDLEGGARAAAFSRATRRLRATAGGRAPGAATQPSSSLRVASVISCTARSKLSWLALEGERWPLTLRTNWTAAASTSSSVAGVGPLNV